MVIVELELILTGLCVSIIYRSFQCNRMAIVTTCRKKLPDFFGLSGDIDQERPAVRGDSMDGGLGSDHPFHYR